MEMREWLSIIVIVVLILIILDGFRRRWMDRKNRVLLKIDKNLPKNAGSGGDFNSELPGAGVRTSFRSDADEYYGSSNESEITEDYNEEDFDTDSDDNDSDYEESREDHEAETPQGTERIEPSFSNDEYDDLEEVGDNRYSAASEYEQQNTESQETVVAAINKEIVAEEDEEESQSILFSQPDLLFEGNEEEDDNSERISEVIVINVMAKKPELFQGKAMLPILLQQGMRLGDMSIFHRHADTSGEGPIMFSMANIVEPGTFEMGDMDDFTTPGVSFFLQLPNSLGNMQSFEKMLEATNSLKDKLGGELKDENRSVITRQTIEHCRQRIRDFELALLANNK